MDQKVLPRKLFVVTKECGHIFLKISSGKPPFICDENTCFYNCLDLFIKKNNILTPNDFNIIKLKGLLTTNLPFANIFTNKDDPSKYGICADHRVVQKAAIQFGINIFVLVSGSYIYKFSPYYKSELTMYMFLHKNHYKLVTDELSQSHMHDVFINPYLVFQMIPPKSKKRRKRGKKKNTDYRDALLGNRENPYIFTNRFDTIADISRQLHFGKKKRRRRRKKKKK